MATFAELEAVQEDVDILEKVVVGCWITAEVIEAENPGTPSHQDRLRWADKLRNTNSNALCLQVLKAVVVADRNETQATILAFSDAEWLSKIDAAINDFEV